MLPILLFRQEYVAIGSAQLRNSYSACRFPWIFLESAERLSVMDLVPYPLDERSQRITCQSLCLFVWLTQVHEKTNKLCLPKWVPQAYIFPWALSRFGDCMQRKYRAESLSLSFRFSFLIANPAFSELEILDEKGTIPRAKLAIPKPRQLRRRGCKTITELFWPICATIRTLRTRSNVCATWIHLSYLLCSFAVDSKYTYAAQYGVTWTVCMKKTIAA